MEFKRRKVRGRSQKLFKEWVSDCGNYRITWANEHEVRHYYGLVLTERFDGKTWWNFVMRRGPYKTFKKTVEECERNRRLWDAFIKLSHSDGRRDGRLETLKARATNTFSSMPVWVRPEADPALIKMLFPCKIQNQDDPTEDLKTSGEASSADTPQHISSQITGPASNAEVGAGSIEKKTETSSKDSSSHRDTNVVTATEPDAALSPPLQPSIRRSSTVGAKRSRRGPIEKRPAKVASRSSRKKKS